MNTRAAPSGLPFRKMHGAGNDFVIIDSRGRGAMMTAALARAIGERHRGVGYDQLAELHDGGEGADLTLDFWNADGSRAGACGNATRCVADLVMREQRRERLSIRTERGLLLAERRAGGPIWVNMGPPLLDWHGVPLAEPADTDALPIAGSPAAVGMGNPHCVFFVDDADFVALEARGPEMEHHPLFPQATNVEFVSVLGPDRLRMRVWERGTGITLACGSGACAVAVAAHRRGLVGRQVALVVDGGELAVEWREDGVWLSGPVADVFQGVLSPAFLAGVA
ncbi:MAG: diaminopimelate epimerase [Pararhodobacter sp.]|nr:diaminopimelate epimerase [Pararhodobacter sp.]